MLRNIIEENIKKMIRRYDAGRATAAEKAFLDAYYDYLNKGTSAAGDGIGEKMKAHIMEHAARSSKHIVRMKPVYRYAVAACLFLMISFSLYLILYTPKTALVAVEMKNDVPPGGNQAILTLSNGQKIMLGNKRGNIARQGTASISLDVRGQVNYSAASTDANKTLYNTLTVPVGNRRNVILSDGTEVSLDAGSELTFPVTFNAGRRNVSLTGQAYFKVKHNAARPFFVKVKNLTIQDIGTEFNINAYGDERAVKTTLFEGSVKLKETILRPGQEAIAEGENIQVQNADLGSVGAWRHNDFVFRNQDLHSTMQQIARWYDVDVVYDGAPEGFRIRAAISRSRNLSAVLQLIQNTGEIKFKIEGRTVTVSR